MKCPYLKGKYMESCMAEKAVYVPSVFELGEYCKSGRHKMCPFYCMAENGGKVVAALEGTDSDSGHKTFYW